MSSHERFSRAMAAIDDYHQKDPNTDAENGNIYPSELLYAKRMTERLMSFAPDADEPEQLAARCQHIGRWEIPRDKYPMDRKGYLQWRNEEKIHHARITEKILSDCGYDADTIEKVRFLLLKKGLNTHAGTQLLEDVACLVFLEFYLEDFAARHDDEKVIDILRKTMKKMSAAAKASVGGIVLSSKNRSLIQRAQH